MTEVLATEGSPATFNPSRRLQWSVLALTVVVVGLLAFGLPRLAAATAQEDELLAAGEPVTMSGISVTPPDGWTRPGAADSLLVVTKQDARIIFFPSDATADGPEGVVAKTAESFGGKKAASIQISEPESFTTTAGVEAAYVVVADPRNYTVLYAFEDGELAALAQVNLSETSWKNLHDEIQTMMETVELSPSEKTS